MTGRKLAALAVLVDDRRRELLVHQSYGSRRWALPGACSSRARAQAAAVREVREELGVEFDPDGLVAVYTLAGDGGIRFVFAGRLDDTPTAHDPAEISEVEWWDLAACRNRSRRARRTRLWTQSKAGAAWSG